MLFADQSEVNALHAECKIVKLFPVKYFHKLS